MEKYSFSHKGPYEYNAVTDEVATDEFDLLMPIYTLFLNESSLVIRDSRKVKGNHGGWYYKHLMVHTYRSYTNEHGDKYLRAFRKTGNGQVFSTSTQTLMYDRFLYDSGKGMRFCDEMIAMIEQHLSKLLGLTFTYKLSPLLDHDTWYKGEKGWESAPETLCYPFLRDKDNQNWLMPLLKEDQIRENESDVAGISNFRWEGVRGLNAALRNSKTKQDFIRNMVYKSAIKTDDDLTCLMTNPSLVRLFSNLNMKMGAKEAVDKGYVSVFQDAYQYMNVSEQHGFGFLLSNLPKRMVVQALDLAVQLAAFRKKQETTGLVENLCELVKLQNEFSYRSPLNGARGEMSRFFRLIPASDKQQFAILFLEEFRKSYLHTEEKYASLNSLQGAKWVDNRDDCFIKVMDAWMKVYAPMFFKPLTSDSMTQCAATAVELFGVDISQDGSLKTSSTVVNELNVTLYHYDFREHVSEKMGRYGYEALPEPQNLFKLFRKSYDTSQIWIDAFNKPSLSIFKDYLKLPGSGRLMLASDLDTTFKKIAATIDKDLLKVGQLLTPENRMIYLEARYEEKRYKSSWRYYHMGVPVEEVPLYKKAGFKSKKDILYWLELRETLPLEMYKELLNDSAYGTAKRDDVSYSF